MRANNVLEFLLTLLRGHPEISTFSAYEITSHKRGEDVAKNVDNLITFLQRIDC